MNRNIHAPTVPSGPTTVGTGFRDLSKLSMVELMSEKERIEAELSAYSSVLTSVRFPYLHFILWSQTNSAQSSKVLLWIRV